MSTVTYKNQPAIQKTGGHIYDGTKHVYTVNKVLWPEYVENFLETLFIGRVLHVCSGKSLLGHYRVDKFDCGAHLQCDALKMPFSDAFSDGTMGFDTILCDPLYNGKFQWNHDLLTELSRIAKQRIIFQHWFVPVDAEVNFKKDHSWKVTSVHLWQPRTYFGRADVITVLDRGAPCQHKNTKLLEAEICDDCHYVLNTWENEKLTDMAKKEQKRLGQE